MRNFKHGLISLFIFFWVNWAQSLEVQDLLTIGFHHRPEVALKKDAKGLIESVIGEYQLLINHQFANIQFRYLRNPQLKKEISFVLNPIISESGEFILQLEGTEAGEKNPFALFEALGLMFQITDSEIFVTPYSYFELIYNAKMGDVFALSNLLKIKMNSLSFEQRVTKKLFDDLFAKGILELASSQNLKELIENYFLNLRLPLLATDLKKQLALENKQKKINSQLRTKRRKERKLHFDWQDMVLSGQREKFAEILYQYLPWEDMAPFEMRIWDLVLAGIKNPESYNERELIFVALDDQNYLINKEGKKCLLSSVFNIKQKPEFIFDQIARNNYESISINGNSQKAASLSRSFRFTTQLINQQNYNQGRSHFISAVQNLKEAKLISDGPVGVFSVDRRLALLNFASNYYQELSVVVPLLTFPDDYIGEIEEAKKFELGTFPANWSLILEPNYVQEKQIENFYEMAEHNFAKLLDFNSNIFDSRRVLTLMEMN